MQFLKNLSLKSKLLLLAFFVFLGLLGITLPYVLHLKERYAYYRLEAKGILYTQNLLGLVAAITEGKKKEVNYFLQKVDELNRDVGKHLNIAKEWKKIKAQVEHYLMIKEPWSQAVYDITSAIIKLDFAIFEESGAIADPDRAAVNILNAHYLSFPQILLHFLQEGNVPSVLVSPFLDHYTYAIKQKKELSSLFKRIKGESISPGVVLIPCLGQGRYSMGVKFYPKTEAVL